MASVIDEIAALLRDRGEGPVSLGDLTNAAGERGFGLILVLFALPMVMPVLPPGTTTAVGILFALLSLQMLLGRRKPWLPASWKARQVSPKIRRFTLQRAIPLLSRLTRWSRPRWSPVTGEVGMRCAALGVLAMGLLLILPLPFVNTFAALAVLCMGLGLIGRDGLFLTAGIGAAWLIFTLFILALIAGESLIADLMQWLPGSFKFPIPFS